MSCGIVDDIEDILKEEANQEHQDHDINRTANKSFILPRSLKKSKINPNVEEDSNDKESNNEGNAPGLASIYVRTWGCTHNNSDSEYMAGQLAVYGYKIVGKLRIYIFLL